MYSSSLLIGLPEAQPMPEFVFGICVTVMVQTSMDVTAPILHMPGPDPSDLAIQKMALLPMLCAHACS